MHAASRSIAAPATAAPVATAAAAASDAEPAPNVRGELRRLFTRAIQAAFPEASAEVALVPCANPKFGDYQCVCSRNVESIVYPALRICFPPPLRQIIL